MMRQRLGALPKYLLWWADADAIYIHCDGCGASEKYDGSITAESYNVWRTSVVEKHQACAGSKPSCKRCRDCLACELADMRSRTNERRRSRAKVSA